MPGIRASPSHSLYFPRVEIFNGKDDVEVSKDESVPRPLSLSASLSLPPCVSP